MVDSGQLRISGNSSELKVSVQLPELGKVEVRAVTSHDVTTAHLTAAHRDALQVLSADRTGLEQALKSRDVILGTLDSHTQRHAAGQQHQQNSQSSAQSSGGASSATAVTSSAMEEAGSVGFLPDYSSISVRA
jgi:flagellar hook-length control protein FliK